MSMMPPLLPPDPSDDGIPAADPGAGAPESAPGFGIGGEDPDVIRPGQERPEGDERAAPQGGETPFRTPDPERIGPDD
jgi:hypothetical protein